MNQFNDQFLILKDYIQKLDEKLNEKIQEIKKYKIKEMQKDKEIMILK